MTATRHVTDEFPATILVVDDAAASRYVSSSWLRRSGHRVIEASTGNEALAALAATEVDLVLLDVGLPDMSGFDVCERIKSDPALAQPVIHLSATAIRGADRAQGLTREPWGRRPRGPTCCAVLLVQRQISGVHRGPT
jgi:CheY-like chemotaxis protein